MALYRFTIPWIIDVETPDLLASHLESTLVHLGLGRGIPVIKVFEALGERRSRIRSMRIAVKWHETRQQEISEQYGRAWLEHGLPHFKGTILQNAYFTLLQKHLFLKNND